MTTPLPRSDSALSSIVWHPALVVSLGALVLGGAVIAASLPGLSTAALVPRADDGRTDGLAALLDEHDVASDIAVDRFRGRSLFYPPPPPPRPAPPRPPAPPPPPVAAPSGPPPTPPPPASYQGRKPSFIVGQTIYFDQGLKISVGEELDGIRVISVNPPWSARLGHQRGEYEVPIFELGNAMAPAVTLDLGSPGTPWLIPDDGRTDLFTGIRTPDAAPAAPVHGRAAGRAGAAAGRPSAGDAPSTPAAPEMEPAEPTARPPVEIPAPLSEDDIAKMERIDVLKAVGAISKAMNSGELDAETKQRLEQELDQLKGKLSTPAAPPPSPPAGS